ncbi:MAG: glycosyltransferase, partial [Burkholderiales bacterium]|nr:glycosyltransferase [Opitutaceae bacterium]
MKILLIGNLPEDRQESMRRFTTALNDGLVARGHTVKVLAPALRLARLMPRYRYNGLPKYLGYFDKFVLFPRALRRHVATTRPDVAHLTDHAGAVYDSALRGTPLLATCHDLFEVRAVCGDTTRTTVGRGGKLYQTWIHACLSRLTHLACVSHATRDDAARLTGLATDRLTVIPNALNYPFQPISAGLARERLATLSPAFPATSEGGFLLQIGGEQWYKNRPGLLAIYAALRPLLTPAPRLVMVGPPLSEEHATLAARLNLTGHITHLSGIDGPQLEALYNLAEGLLFPSLAEGFGWPVAEAQACGCPVF